MCVQRELGSGINLVSITPVITANSASLFFPNEQLQRLPDNRKHELVLSTYENFWRGIVANWKEDMKIDVHEINSDVSIHLFAMNPVITSSPCPGPFSPSSSLPSSKSPEYPLLSPNAFRGRNRILMRCWREQFGNYSLLLISRNSFTTRSDQKHLFLYVGQS